MELVEDCYVLLALKDHLTGGSPIILNWNPNIPINEWQGVTVDTEINRVVTLDLRSRSMTGQVPSQLAELSALQHLWLGRNQLRGEIPRELCRLASLEDMSITDNPELSDFPSDCRNITRPTIGRSILKAFHYWCRWHCGGFHN